MLATGTGAQYPMLTFAVQNLIQNYPDAVGKVGVFPLPGSDAAQNGLTVWMPDGVYIPRPSKAPSSTRRRSSRRSCATKEACDIIGSKSGASGPFVVDGCTLPADVPPIVSDQQPYFDQGKTGLALEFLSPIKGPALEQITVSIGSGHHHRRRRRGAVRRGRQEAGAAARPAGLVGSRALPLHPDGAPAVSMPSARDAPHDNSPDGGGPMTTQAATAGSALAPQRQAERTHDELRTRSPSTFRPA